MHPLGRCAGGPPPDRLVIAPAAREYGPLGRWRRVTPGIDTPFAPPGGRLPLRFRGQSLPEPPAVGYRTVPGDLRNRMVRQARRRRETAGRNGDTRIGIVQLDEHAPGAVGEQAPGVTAPHVLPRHPSGRRVAPSMHVERLEKAHVVGIGHLRCVDAEGLQLDLVHRSRVARSCVAADAVDTGGDRHHVGRRPMTGQGQRHERES